MQRSRTSNPAHLRAIGLDAREQACLDARAWLERTSGGKTGSPNCMPSLVGVRTRAPKRRSARFGLALVY